MAVADARRASGAPTATGVAEERGQPAAPPPQVKQVAWSRPTPAVPPKPSYWDQVREQEARWEHEMKGLLTIVAEQQPAVLREPQAAVSACVEQQMRNADRTSSYFESLVRHGDAIETGLVTVQRTARRLCGLLEQSPAAEPSLGSRPLTEHGIRWAVAAIRRGEERTEAAAILGRVIRDELAPIAGLSRDLREVNVTPYASIFTSRTSRTSIAPAIAPGISRRRFNAPSSCRRAYATDLWRVANQDPVSQPPVPEPERSTAPEGPKASAPRFNPPHDKRRPAAAVTTPRPETADERNHSRVDKPETRSEPGGNEPDHALAGAALVRPDNALS